MDAKQVAELVDNQRWLMNNGLFNDAIKNNLYLYGSLVHKDVKAVELTIYSDKKLITYDIYLEKGIIKKYNKFKELQKSNSIWSLFWFKRMLKKEGNLNFESILDKFIKDFCGPKWSTETRIKDIESYEDSIQGTKDERATTDSQGANR